MRLTIRQTMSLGLILLSLIIAGLLGTMMVREWRGLSTLSSSAQATTAVAKVSQATIELSLERSLTQVTLNLDDPIGGDLKTMLDSQRELSDRLFLEARDILFASTRIGARETLVQRLDDDLGKMRQFRLDADAQLSLPLSQRNSNAVDGIPSSIKETVLSLDSLSVTLRSYMQDAPQVISATDKIIQQAWIIREFGGRERTLFAIATARQEPISRADLSYMFQNHGKVLQAWWDIEHTMRYANLDASVLEAAKTLEKAYFTEYGALRKELVGQSVEGTYSADFQTLFTRSEAALQTAISLLNTAVVSNSQNVSQGLTASRTKLGIEAVVALLVLAALGYVAWFVVAKVVTPLTSKTDAMKRLANQDLEIDIPSRDRSDEMGQMAGAVQVFKDNMVEAERLRAAQSEDQVTRERRQATIEAAIAEFEQSASSAIESVGGAVNQLETLALVDRNCRRNVNAVSQCVVVV
jgi:HAMP domain-containing protein